MCHGLMCHGSHVSQRSIICCRLCVCARACLVASVRAAPATNARRFSDVARQGRCHHISPTVRCHHLPPPLLSTGANVPFSALPLLLPVSACPDIWTIMNCALRQQTACSGSGMSCRRCCFTVRAPDGTWHVQLAHCPHSLFAILLGHTIRLGSPGPHGATGRWGHRLSLWLGVIVESGSSSAAASSMFTDHRRQRLGWRLTAARVHDSKHRPTVHRPTVHRPSPAMLTAD